MAGSTKVPRKRNIFLPGADKPFLLSRSKLENFITCQHCFYLDRRLGVGRPSIPGYTLNLAIDQLLKSEFDIYRQSATRHPLLIKHNLSLVPFAHESIDDWRNIRKGIRFVHQQTNFELYGAIDDLWIDSDKTLYIVDYKATSSNVTPTLDAPYRSSYKRQMEIYQWLFRQNGFTVSDTGYFVYANGDKNAETFQDRLLFKTELIAYTGDSSWVERAVVRAYECLCREKAPPPADDCEYCAYRVNANNVLKVNSLSDEDR